MSAVLAAARGLSRRAVAVPAAGAVALVAVASPVLDDPGWAGVVLPGVALLLALAAAAAVDEPDARLLDASPTTFARRVLRRLAVTALVVVPLGVAATGWALLRGADLSWSLAREAAALLVAALLLSAAVRRWTALPEPAVVTGGLLVAGLLLGRFTAPYLPGLPGSSAHAWAVGLGAGVLALLVVLRDPATAAHGVRRR